MPMGIRCVVITVLLAAGMAAGQSSHLPDAPSSAKTEYARPAEAVPSQLSVQGPPEQPFQPLTPKQKFQHFVRHTYSPYTLVDVLYNATYAQATGDPYGYGGGMEGWGKRIGASAASTEARGFFGTFLFPALLHQDPRFFPRYNGSFFARAFHAVGRVVVTRADDGHSVFNSSGLLGIAFNEALKNAYLPERDRGLDVTFSRMLGAMQGDATAYVLREFTPDLLRAFRHHSPRQLKKLEEKIPPQVISGASSD